MRLIKLISLIAILNLTGLVFGIEDHKFDRRYDVDEVVAKIKELREQGNRVGLFIARNPLERLPDRLYSKDQIGDIIGGETSMVWVSMCPYDTPDWPTSCSREELDFDNIPSDRLHLELSGFSEDPRLHKLFDIVTIDGLYGQKSIPGIVIRLWMKYLVPSSESAIIVELVPNPGTSCFTDTHLIDILPMKIQIAHWNGAQTDALIDRWNTLERDYTDHLRSLFRDEFSVIHVKRGCGWYNRRIDADDPLVLQSAIVYKGPRITEETYTRELPVWDKW